MNPLFQPNILVCLYLKIWQLLEQKEKGEHKKNDLYITALPHVLKYLLFVQTSVHQLKIPMTIENLITSSQYTTSK